MDYSKFYTPVPIASLLVKCANVTNPPAIVDICCGSCNLLHAAKQRWTHARLIGVDINPHTFTDVDYIKTDGRRYAIENTEKYLLVLANPPFDFVEKDREFPQLYQGIFSSYRTKRLENEMLLANLLLLQENGTLVIILPSTFVEAEKNKKIRQLIGANYFLQKIIRLPENTFGSANINSYALIIKNCVPSRRTTCYTVVCEDGKYIFTQKHSVPQRNIRMGEWHNEDISSNETLEIRRGNVSSQSFCERGIAVLHTARVRKVWTPSLRYCTGSSEKPVYAERGDIIVSRIGKSAGKWCIYQGEKIMISDCLYRIKDPTGEISARIKGHEYSLSQKGVATRYITIADFKKWYSSLEQAKTCE